MASFVIRRVLLSLLVLLAVSYGSFILIATKFTSTCYSRYTPNEAYPPLADSVPHATTLWLRWLRQVPSGKAFADACGSGENETVLTGLAHTAALLALTIVIVLVASVAIGVLAAVRARTWFDLVFRVSSYLAWATPAFLTALVLQTGLISIAHHGLHWFPASGWPGLCPAGFFTCTTPPAAHGAAQAAKVLQSLAVPALALSIAFVGLHGRYLRSALLASMGAPFTTTARAKGLTETRIVLRHALRNSLGVFAGVLLLDFGTVIGASLAVDFVFRLGGLGLIFLNLIGGLGDQSGDHAKYLDAYAVMSVLTLTAIFVAAASLLAELVVVWLDPRVRPA
jgi:peptide/nickel transport system permease protein